MRTYTTITPIPALKDNYIWAVIDDDKRQTIIVDPGEATPVLAFLQEQQLQLTGILITHHHWDHTDGIVELKSHYSIPIFGSANEAIPGVTNKVHDQDEINIVDFPLTFRVIDIPGHTLGHIAYYAPGILFCGDTLFAAGCGRVFEGTMEQMYSSLQKIAALPDDTKIYCAHEYTLNNLRFAKLVEPSNKNIEKRLQQIEKMRKNNLPTLPSTLKEEKATNPFLRCDSTEIITHVENHIQMKLHYSSEVFTQLRKWKNIF